MGTETFVFHFVFLWTNDPSVIFFFFQSACSVVSGQLFLQIEFIFQLYKSIHLHCRQSALSYSLLCTAGSNSVLQHFVLFCPSFFSPLCSHSLAQLCAAADKSLFPVTVLRTSEIDIFSFVFLVQIQWQTALFDCTNISKCSIDQEDWLEKLDIFRQAVLFASLKRLGIF